MLTQKFLNSVISLLVIANPLAVASVFVGLMAQSPPKEIKATAIKSVTVATGILVFFALFGQGLLTGLGIRLPSFHIAGGILLFAIAFRMLFGDGRTQGAGGEPMNAYADRSDVAVFPLAIPLIAGPGCMTVIILLISRATDAFEQAAVFVALAIVMGLTLGCLLAARAVLRVIGTSGTIIIARVMGVILAARSVQFIVDGLRDVKTLYFS